MNKEAREPSAGPGSHLSPAGLNVLTADPQAPGEAEAMQQLLTMPLLQSGIEPVPGAPSSPKQPGLGQALSIPVL